MNTIRMNITLPSEVAEMLKNVKNKSSFIAEAIRERIEREEKAHIYWVNLDPVEGSETGKVYPFEAFIHRGIANLPDDSKAKANQMRIVDKKRIKKFIGKVPDATLKEIERAVKIHLDFK